MYNIVCLAKFTPDIQNFVYDYEKNVLVRENTKLVLNPDDACAIAAALKLKEKNKDINIHVVSMGPESVLELVRDLLRRGVDEATLISDRKYVGSDTFVTSKVLASYLKTLDFDVVFTGTHTLDGDTAHVPSQVADILKLEQMSGVAAFDFEQCDKERFQFEVISEESIDTYEITLPALLAVSDESGYKLPFVRRKDLDKNVDDRLKIISNKELGLPEDMLGLAGSPTRVVKTHTRELEKREQVVVQLDQEGIDVVYEFLKAKGFV